MKVKRAMSVIQAGLSRALKSDVHGHCHETRVKCERQLDDAIEAALAVKARLRLDRDAHRNGDRVARLGDVRE
jgi:predicted GNAT superfamily acetyltransferase